MCSKLNKANKETTTTSTTSTSTSLDTPVTEVVTPTSVFNSLNSYEVLVPGETMDSREGNRESAVNGNALPGGITIKQEPGTEAADLSSPEAKRTLLQL